jgi:hypothetical protein
MVKTVVVKRGSLCCNKSICLDQLLTVSCFFSLVTFSRIAWSGEWVFDFEDPKQADHWKVANGNWKIQKGVYTEISAAEKAAHTLFGEADWTDYTVETKIRIDANKWAGLVFRAISEYDTTSSIPSRLLEFRPFFNIMGRIGQHGLGLIPTKLKLREKFK